jgi:hypothetical protein
MLFATPFQAAATEHAYRTAIMRHLEGEIPTSIIIKINTRHTVDSVVYESLYKLAYEFEVESQELEGDFNMGVLENQDVGAEWTAPDTGSYGFTMGIPNTTGFIQARINGGSWSNIILVNQTTGTLAGVTAGDTIEVRSNTSLSLALFDTMLIIDSPISDEDAYAIFYDAP